MVPSQQSVQQVGAGVNVLQARVSQNSLGQLQESHINGTFAVSGVSERGAVKYTC